MKTVMVSGKFDPPHDGHIIHMLEASVLGDYLYVVVQTDEGVRCVKNGKCEIPFWARLALVKGILILFNIKGEAVQSSDSDGKTTETLMKLRPDIYAKGGDRYPGNLPQEEVDACSDIGCEIIYGIGDQLNQSSKMNIDRGDT